MTAQTVIKTIHFVDDGLTAFGKVWYKGEELDVTEELYEKSKDIHGHSWLDQTEEDQIERRGKVTWREGPWTGEPWDPQLAKKVRKVRTMGTGTKPAAVQDPSKKPFGEMKGPGKQTSSGLKMLDEQPAPIEEEPAEAPEIPSDYKSILAMAKEHGMQYEKPPSKQAAIAFLEETLGG